MHHELATLHVNTLREFLSHLDTPYWDLINESGDESRDLKAVTTDELIERLYFYSVDGMVFLFAPHDHDPLEIGWDGDYEKLPTLREPSEIGPFTRPSGGNDFLYISPDIPHAEVGQYFTLLPRDSESGFEQ